MRALAGLVALTLLLGGCASGAVPVPVRPAAPAKPRSSTAVVPQVMAPAGLEGVIGAPAAALTGRFGAPRIDLAEGDARKLQFAGATCVVDIYLYPLAAAAEPTATHVEARLRQGGAPADPGRCIREIIGRR